MQAVELFTHMVYVRHPEVALCMKNHRVILTCLKYCFDYELNNTLHGLVTQAVASMCEEFDLATTVDDYRGLFEATTTAPNLLDAVLDAYDASDALLHARGYNACYMGHLHIVANTIHDASIKCAQMMEDHPLQYLSLPQATRALSTVLIPPPPDLPLTDAAAKRNASITSLGQMSSPPSQYSPAALEVASVIVQVHPPPP